MSKHITSKQIIKLIGSDHLELHRAIGYSYWYFRYDHKERDLFVIESVYTSRLKDMTIDQWVQLGKDFISRMEST